MKKILGTMILALAVCANLFAAKPVELKEYKQSTYNTAYFDWWYFGVGSDNTYFGMALYNEQGKEVAFSVLSLSETDYAAYMDGVEFKDEYEDRDVESHYYISTYWILNSPNGVRWGENAIVQSCVEEVSDGSNSMFALKPGKYYFRVAEIFINDGQASMGTGYAQISFSLGGDLVQGLKAEVAADKKSATISWTKSSLPADAHLYLNVQSGDEVAYDNYNEKTSPANPLTVAVTEGRTYKVTARYVTSKQKPLGGESVITFTVGTNNYVPQNANATVADYNKVTFTWTAAAQAEAYVINVYSGISKYAEFNATEQSLTKQLPAGSYTWEVAAMEKGDDNKYYVISDYVQGNAFSTEDAPLPEGTIEMNIQSVVAASLDIPEGDADYRAGKYGWLILLESNTTNELPEPWIFLYSDRQFAVSGIYSKSAGNIAFGDQVTFMNTTGEAAGLETASDASLTLEFEGFDFEYEQMGYYIPYYSGEFFMSCTNGKNYHAVFNQLICSPITYESMFSSSPVIINMLDEDGSMPHEIENIIGGEKSIKRIENGQLIIERNGVKYNAFGTVIY